MPIDPELVALMQDSITIEPYTGQSVNTEETYGSSVSYTCRVVGRRKMVRTATGEEAVSQVTVWLDRVADINPRSRITLPSRFTPQQPPILAIESFPDEQGTSGTGAHSVIYC